MSNDPADNDTIQARRRRPSGQSQGQRERAEAPERRRDDDEQQAAPEPARPPTTTARPRPTTSSGGLSSTSGGLSSAGSGAPIERPSGGCGLSGPVLIMLIGAGLLVVCCVVLAIMFMPGGDEAAPTQTAPLFEFATATPFVARTSTPTPVVAAARPTTQPSAASPTPVAPVGGQPSGKQGQTWLVMLYGDADDKTLEQDIFLDLNEAERVGSTDRVQIVAQLDRYRGGFAGDKNWTSTKRFYVTRDDDLERIGSRELADLGEVNMADPRSLVDFATWAMKTYPADKYALILSDHGMGWPGGWSDPDPSVRTSSNIPIAQALGNVLLLRQLDEALAEIRTRSGVAKLEFIGLDACLMSHIEVYSALAPHALYAVASQETEPSLGWAYTKFLQELAANPNMSGADLGRSVVRSYIQDDQRILDDRARAELVGQTSGIGGLFGAPPRVSAQQLAQQMSQEITLSAVDLSRLPAVMSALNTLAVSMQDAKQDRIALSRTHAQGFTSVFGSQLPKSYLDLGHFASLLKKESGNTAVAQNADRLIAELRSFVLAEKHGPGLPGATGVSIYFPNSQLYQSAVTGATSYTAVANRFASESLWDDFLLFHYSGSRFRALPTPVPAQKSETLTAGAVPQRGAAITAPGAEKLKVSALRLSATSVALGKTVRMSADVEGTNVGYIYIFAGYYDQAGTSIFIADMDYLDSSVLAELDGVYYPYWGDKGKFTLQFDWEPFVFGLTDGKTTAVVPLMPQQYGATPEDAVYTVEGTYTFADDGQSLTARLYMSDGVLRHVYGFTGAEEVGAPREIIPAQGDRFTILERWIDVKPGGQGMTSATQAGKTLTFSNQTFTWKELDAAAGDYVIGFIVQDLDGNKYETFGKVTVK